MTDLTEQEAIRFSEYLDGEMSSDERAAFEEELASDPALAEALDAFAKTLDVLGGMAAPEVDLAGAVERKIRRRSRGRYFGSSSLYRQRVQTEIFIAIALLLLAGIALMATPGGLRALLGTQEFELVEEPEAVPDEPGNRDSNPEGSAERAGSAPPTEMGAAEPSLDETPEPTPVGEGATSGAPVLAMHREEFLYTVRTDLSAEALQRRVADQFGGFDLSVGDGELRLAVPRAQVGEVVAAVGGIGVIERTRGRVEGTPATLDIVFLAGQ